MSYKLYKAKRLRGNANTFEIKTKNRAMKMITLTFLIFGLVSGVLKAPEAKTIPILVTEAVNPYTTIVRAVTLVESSGGVNMINKKENAVGHFGIRPIRLLDYNIRTGKTITHEQCYDYEISKMIFLYYVSQVDYRDIKAIAICWNGASKHNHYYQKILKALNTNQI